MYPDYKKEIVSNIRGYYFTQIIASLYKSNLFLELLKNKKIKKKKIKSEFSSKKIEAIFDYLININYLFYKNGYYFLTELGADIFLRYFTFLVPHSYNNYFFFLKDFLRDKKKLSVNRDENIIGSGLTHKRYFLNALSYIKNNLADSTKINVIDIGVGNGDFLKLASSFLDVKNIFGIDYSQISVDLTNVNLKKIKVPKKIIRCDARNVDLWSKKAKLLISENEEVYIFMWFLIHEISGHSSEKITNFLRTIKKNFPNSKIIVCELMKIKNDILSSQSKISLMPEYYLFHEFSEQGIMSEIHYKKIFKKSGYLLNKKIEFDRITKDNKKYFSSCNIFFLES
jgi:hypothetical protein